MKLRLFVFFELFLLIILSSCNHKEKNVNIKIIFLHQSTGSIIWQGDKISLVQRAARKLSPGLTHRVGKKPILPLLFEEYNEVNDKNYLIKEMPFPKVKTYGGSNNPYDYYNIWVKNSGEKPFMEVPTLEMLSKEYQVIILKHCFPVSNILPDEDSPDINSRKKTIANYKLQYSALKEKFNEFPDTKFILFTGAAQIKSSASEDQAKRAKEFFYWVINEWDQPGDNIYLWDLYNLQTEEGLYFKNEYAESSNDPHPSGAFAGRVVNLLFNRIIDIIENNGNGTSLSGERKFQSYR